MGMDANGMSHKPSGLPQGVAGTYEAKGGAGADDDIDALLDGGADLGAMRRNIVEGNAPAPQAATDGGSDRQGISQGTSNPLSAEETQALLQRAEGVAFGKDGTLTLTLKGGVTVTPDRALDLETARRDPHVKQAVRGVYRSDLSDRSAAERRGLMHTAWRYATPYDRRRAIDTSANRRYIPATAIAHSLRGRKDQAAAADMLIALHYEDASAAMNVVRAGYPGLNNPKAAWKYINHTKNMRYEKDILDENGKVAHKKGSVICGSYVNSKGKETYGPLPNPKGAAARSYLRMFYQPTNGVPSERESRDITRVLESVKDDPQVQAQMFWDLCYGDGHPSNLRGNVDYAKSLLARQPSMRRRLRVFNQRSSGDGQGNVARVAAYRKVLSPEAARVFINMEPGDNRLANTQYLRKKKGKEYRPKRLTEMRSFIRAVYEISDRPKKSA